MANVIRSISEEDAEWLRKFIREMRQNPRPQSRYKEEREIGQSPEVYLALTPTGGIPALTDPAGTGTGSSYDLTGSAECAIYRVVKQGSLNQLREIDGLTRFIHNASPEIVPGGIYTPVERDKFGTWWVTSNPAHIATTPPDCVSITMQETDLRCERNEGTGTGGAIEGSLNLYRRDVVIDMSSGCPTVTRGEWALVKAVACCDPECTYDERFWWCINDNLPCPTCSETSYCVTLPGITLQTGTYDCTGAITGTDCASLADPGVQVDQTADCNYQKQYSSGEFCAIPDVLFELFCLDGLWTYRMSTSDEAGGRYYHFVYTTTDWDGTTPRYFTKTHSSSFFTGCVFPEQALVTPGTCSGGPTVPVDCCTGAEVPTTVHATLSGCLSEVVALTYSDLGGGVVVWNGNILGCGDAVALRLRCDSGTWELWWSGGAVTDTKTNTAGNPLRFGPSNALETLGCCGLGQTVTVTFNDIVCDN